MSDAGLRELLRLHDAARGDQILKESDRVRVTRVALDSGGAAVCKEDRGGGLRSQLGRVLRGSRAARSWAAARALSRAEFSVPEPLGLLEEGERAVYFARHVPGPTLAEALATASPIRARQLALAAADLTARLHEAGFAFRDLKPVNLVVVDDDLVPVDLDDVRRPRRLPRRIVWRNLAALDAHAQEGPHPLSVRTRWAALEAYGRARGVDPRALVSEVLRRSRAKRRRWDAHGGRPWL